MAGRHVRRGPSLARLAAAIIGSSATAQSRPQCRDPHCPDFGDPDFGEATCPAEHAEACDRPPDVRHG